MAPPPRVATLGWRRRTHSRFGRRIKLTGSGFLYDPEARRNCVTQRGKCKRTNCNIAHSFRSGWFHREEGQRISWLASAGSVYEAGIGATKFHETEAEILRHLVETPTV